MFVGLLSVLGRNARCDAMRRDAMRCCTPSCKSCVGCRCTYSMYTHRHRSATMRACPPRVLKTLLQGPVEQRRRKGKKNHQTPQSQSYISHLPDSNPNPARLEAAHTAHHQKNPGKSLPQAVTAGVLGMRGGSMFLLAKL